MSDKPVRIAAAVIFGLLVVHMLADFKRHVDMTSRVTALETTE